MCSPVYKHVLHLGISKINSKIVDRPLVKVLQKYHLTNYNEYFFAGRPLCMPKEMWTNVLCLKSHWETGILI